MRTFSPFLIWALANVQTVLGDTCSDVEATTSIDVSRPLSVSYIAEQQEYWSTSCAALKPSCILFPTTAQEVSAILSILSQNDENFAVKSGGHNPNNYYASVEGGPLISTAKLDQVNLDITTGIARIGPGQRLDSVAKALDGTGWTFVGGRIGNTGVGGLMLGGGLSYMSTQYGWASSSVLEYEIVLANGTITTASASQNEDLFTALKGGGNNFGVVTLYTLQTYPQGDIWGGNLVFARTPAIDTKLLKAVRDFAEYSDDPKAAVIVTAERANLNAVDSWILFLFYDGPSPPEHTFKNFTDAGPILNTLKTQSYSSLIGGSNWVIVPASVVQIAAETIPVPSAADGEEMMGSIHAHWRKVSSSTILTPGVVSSIAYQPFPRRLCEQALARGADLIDCDADGDRFILEMNQSFLPQTLYEPMADALEETYTGVRSRVRGWQAEGRLPDVYLPLFMNYGFYRQDYWARLKPSSRQLAATVAESVDPNGLFRDRTGGWKP